MSNILRIVEELKHIPLVVFLLLSIVVSNIVVPQAYCIEENEKSVELLVTLQAHDELLGDVLKKVSAQTGVSILYDEKYADKKVSFSFYGASLEDVINRVFQGVNKLLTINSEEQVLVVETFGVKKYALAYAEETSNKETRLSVFDGMTQQELADLHQKQYADYKKSLENMEEIEPGTDLTRGELKNLHERQYDQYKEGLKDMGEIQVGTGQTRGQLNVLHEKQYQEYKESQKDLSKVVPGVNISQGELENLHNEQYSRYKEGIKDDKEIIPGLEMTRGELKVLHDAQYKEYKRK